jgi:hypothetical protein
MTSSPAGCQGCRGGGPGALATNITISLERLKDQTGTSWVLADGIDANDDLTVVVQVTIPNVPQGRYVVVGHGDQASGAGQILRVST